MYISSLLINVGDNPDRPRPGRLWLRNVYHVHQRLCMAFASELQKKDDPDFLKPYKPCGFPDPRPTECAIEVGPSTAPRFCSVVGQLPPIHVPRDTDHNFLFRIDSQPGNRVVIVVQSASKPDWDYAFGLKPGLVDPHTHRPIGNAGHLLAAPPSKPRIQPLSLEAGTRLRFRLVANPVRKVSERSVDGQGKSLGERWLGKQVPVPSTEEDLRNWIERRAEPGWSAPKNSEHEQFPPGFRLDQVSNIQTGYVFVNKTRDSAKGQRFRSARYDGVLTVTNSERFRDTVVRGIGPAKAFGFGLLSLAPA